jgi:hypothetical protein
MSDPATTKRAIEMVRDKKRLDWLETQEGSDWACKYLSANAFRMLNRKAIDKAMENDS